MKAFLAGALVGAVLTVGVAANGVSAASTHDGTTTIELLAPPGGKTTEVIPVGSDDHAVGDYFVTTDGPLVHPKSRKPAGSIDGIETILGPVSDAVNLTVRLSHGMILVVGQRRHPDTTNTLVVVGGTGTYAGVTGTLELTEIGDTGKALMTFHLKATE
jgi:hypothetical protein